MEKNVRIVQLIDSLEAGGAERMAINYANTLADVLPFSGLVATRKEGALKAQVSDKVDYLFLNKRGKLGFGAVLKFRSFIKKNKIEVIHAHSSSFFTAVLVKLTHPKVKVVWHDHYGNSEFLKERSTTLLRKAALLFTGVISVNVQLKEWTVKSLHFRNVIYLPNFVFFTTENQNLTQTVLKGNSGKRIVCLANLREQKNHPMLLEVAALLKESHSDWSFHLVGKDFEDAYSESLKQAIATRLLENHVFIYGSRNDIGSVLNQSEIGVLTSKSEGLPVALLEYGFYNKAVLTTSVGEIPTVIENGVNGISVSSEDVYAFYGELVRLIEDAAVRVLLAKNLSQHVADHYSEKAVVHKYLEWIEKM